MLAQVTAAAIRDWLLHSQIQCESGPHRGALLGWLSEDRAEPFYYPEATGYYLTWLEDLARSESAHESPIRARATASFEWIERLVTIDPRIPTRIPVIGAAADWRSRAFFSFDWAVVVRGLVAAGSLLGVERVRPTLEHFLRAGAPFFQVPGRMRAYVLREESAAALPERWSTRTGPHHAKACALLDHCTRSWASDLVPDAIAAALPIVMGKSSQAFGPTDGGKDAAHGWLYGLEGLLVFARAHSREELLDLGFEWWRPFVASYRPSLTDERTDVVAQTLRTGVALATLGRRDSQSPAQLLQLRDELLQRVLPDGAVAFHPTSAAGPLHRNAWCAMFLWQALDWWQRLERDDEIAMDGLV